MLAWNARGCINERRSANAQSLLRTILPPESSAYKATEGRKSSQGRPKQQSKVSKRWSKQRRVFGSRETIREKRTKRDKGYSRETRGIRERRGVFAFGFGAERETGYIRVRRDRLGVFGFGAIVLAWRASQRSSEGSRLSAAIS